MQVVEKTAEQVQGLASTSEKQSTAMNEASQAVEQLSRRAQNLHELMQGLRKG
ncbi:MAG: hypothetical protein ACOC43_15800 [Desulfohalobiaceae bacterium]